MHSEFYEQNLKETLSYIRQDSTKLNISSYL
jgi:hypothetical protein